MNFRNTHADRDEREFENFVLELQNDSGLSMEVPKLDEAAMKAKDNFPDHTFYLNMRRVKNRTALFFPPDFDPAKDAHLMFYFHGHLKGAPHTGATIKEYLNSSVKDGNLNIRQHIIDSRQNVILVAPTLGSKSEAGMLTAKKAWNTYVTDIYDGVDEYIFNKNFPGAKRIRGKTILAAHSGGGSPMLKIAMHSGADEIWGFDSIYQGGDYREGKVNHESWPNMALKFLNAKLYFYFTKGDDNMDKAVKGVCCTKAMEPQKFAAVKLINVTGEGHFEIIKKRMAVRLAALSPGSNSSENYSCEVATAAPPSPMPAPEPERRLRPKELKEMKHQRRFPRPYKDLEYETLLDEILNELSYEEGVSDANLGFRRKMAEIAETEWSVHWQNGTLKENSPLVSDVMTGYYAEAFDINRKAAAVRAKKAQKGTSPWSATFVSWVVKKAAESTGRKPGFTYAAGHAQYVGDARAASRKPGDNEFRYFSPKKVKPEIGDIICYNRKPAAHDTCGTHCSHCDIVVEVKANEVLAIGGNTENQVGTKNSGTVGKKIIALNENGLLADQRYTDVLKYISSK